jgi:hypothetical protein
MNHWMMSNNNSNLNLINNSTQTKMAESNAKKKSKKLKERFKEKPNKQINQHQFMINSQPNMIHQPNMMMNNSKQPMLLQNNLSYPYANIKNHYKGMHPPSFYNQPMNYYPPYQNIYDYYMSSNNAQNIVQNNKKAHKRSKHTSDNSKRDDRLMYSQNNPHKLIQNDLHNISSENEEKVIALDSSEEKIQHEESSFSKSNFNVSPSNIMHTPTYFNNEQFTQMQYSPNDNIYSLNKMNRQLLNQNLSPMNHYINYEANLNSSDENLIEEKSGDSQVHFKDDDNQDGQSKMKYFMDDLSNHSSKDNLDENNLDKYLEFIYKEDDDQELKTPSREEYLAKTDSVYDDNNEEFHCFLDKKESEEFSAEQIASSERKIDNLPCIQRIKKRNKQSSEDK